MGHVESHIKITGFTLNPIKDYKLGESLMFGLGQYPKEHVCDFNPEIKHTNYLGTIEDREIIYSKYIEEVGNRGLVVFAPLTNGGHYTLRIWDESYPAYVQFEAYIKNRVYDADLILDHLKAPAFPWDGIGLFDETCSIAESQIRFSPLMKSSEKFFPGYVVKDPLIIDHENTTYSGYLNELDKIFCYFCEFKAEFWGITRPPIPNSLKPDDYEQSEDLYPFKLIPVCQEHLYKTTRN